MWGLVRLDQKIIACNISATSLVLMTQFVSTTKIIADKNHLTLNIKKWVSTNAIILLHI